MTIRAVADKQAEASAALDLKDVSERKVEFDYLQLPLCCSFMRLSPTPHLLSSILRTRSRAPIRS
jgi:hypothetical protein